MSHPLSNGPRILAAVGVKPMSQGQLVEALGIAAGTACLRLKDLMEAKQVHIVRWERNKAGGPFTAFYAAGKGRNAPKPKTTASSARLAAYRRRQKIAKAEAEARAAEELRRRGKPPKRDPITAALFAAPGKR